MITPQANTDEQLILKCIELAKERGLGKVHPNPMVGCVIVKNGEVISEGAHEYFGGPHAEVNALNKAKASVEGATLYVNLEPCVHWGKTPPCTDLIIEKKIARVVIGSLDANPLVAGGGVKKLTDNGIEVVIGVLEDECRELNKAFLKFIEKKEPYYALKVAQTIDGKIADPDGSSKYITNLESRKYVHKLRSEYDAVLIGINTLINDDPLLDARLIKGKSPHIILFDSKLRIDMKAKLLGTISIDRKMIVFTSEEMYNSYKGNQLKMHGVNLIPTRLVNDRINTQEISSHLVNLGIISVLVEGGAQVFSSFVRENMVDELIVFTAPKLLGKGISSFDNVGICKMEDILEFSLHRVKQIENDILAIYRKN